MPIVENIIESLAVKHIQNVGFTALGKDFTQENRLVPNPHQLLSKQIPAEEWQNLTPVQAISLGRVRKHIVKMIPDSTTGTYGNEKAFYADKSQDIQNAGGAGFLYGFLSVPGSADWGMTLYEDNGSGTAPDYSKSITLGKGNSWAIDASSGILWLESGTTLNAFRKPFWLVGYTYVGKTLDIYEYQEQLFDNLVINSSFEHWFQNPTCPDGWEKGNGNFASSIDNPLFGNSCLAINQVPGQQYWIRQYPSGFEPSPPAEGYQKLGKGWEKRDLCFSVYAKSSSAIKTLKLRIEDGIGTTENSFVITDQWQRYKIVHRINVGADRIRIYIAPEAIGSVATTTVNLNIDGVMLTVGSALIPWLPRSINDTYDNRLFGNLRISSDLIVDEEIAIKKSNPETDLDVNGRGRFQVSGIIPLSGSGTEIYYDQVNLVGRLLAYDRTLNQYRGFLIGDETTKQLFLTANGNRIGILRDDPQSTLDVKGDLRLSSNNNAELIKYALSNLYIQNEGNNNELIHVRPGGSSQGNLYSAISLYTSSENLSYSEKIRLHTNGDSYLLGGKLGIGTDQPKKAVDIRGDLVLESSKDAFIYTGTGTTELNRYLFLLNSPDNETSSGLKAGGILVADDYGYANPGKNDLIVKGKVGIGNGIINMSSYWEQADDLVVGDINGHGGLTIRARNDSDSTISFADSDSGTARYVGRIVYRHTDNSMLFNTNCPTGESALIIDANGNVTIKGIISGASLNVGTGIVTCGNISSADINTNGKTITTKHLQSETVTVTSQINSPYIYHNDNIVIDIDHDNNATDKTLVISHDNGVELLKLNESGLLNLRGKLEADGRVQAIGGILAGSLVDSLQSELIVAYNGNFAISSPDKDIVNGTNLGGYRWYADDNSSGEGLEYAAEVGYYATGTWDSTYAPAKISLGIKASADVLPVECFYVDYLKDGWIGRDFRVIRNLQVDGTIRAESSLSVASADLRGGALTCGSIVTPYVTATIGVWTPLVSTSLICNNDNVQIDIDHDSNNTDRKFYVTKDNGVTELFNVNESGNGYFAGALSTIGSISGSSLSVGNGAINGGTITGTTLIANGSIYGNAPAGAASVRNILYLADMSIIYSLGMHGFVGIKSPNPAIALYDGGITFGTNRDTSICRIGAEHVKIFNNLTVNTSFSVGTNGLFVDSILSVVNSAATAMQNKLVTELAVRNLHDSHANRVDNPHTTTAAQVGLGSVPNWSSTDFDNRYLNQSSNLSDLTNTDTALANLGCTTLLKRFNGTWLYGSISLSGSTNGWAGFYFNDIGRCFMLTGSQAGVYTTDSTWQWLWNNGILEVGTVPVGRLSGVGTLTRGTGLTGDSFNVGVNTTWGVDFGGNGGSNQVARADHSHPLPDHSHSFQLKTIVDGVTSNGNVITGGTFTLNSGTCISITSAGSYVVIGVSISKLAPYVYDYARSVCIEKDTSGEIRAANASLRLWNTNNTYGDGATLYFGDSEYAYIREYEDDKLSIHASKILLDSSNFDVETLCFRNDSRSIKTSGYRMRFDCPFVPVGDGGGYDFCIDNDLVADINGTRFRVNGSVDAINGYKQDGQSLDNRYVMQNGIGNFEADGQNHGVYGLSYTHYSAIMGWGVGSGAGVYGLSSYNSESAVGVRAESDFGIGCTGNGAIYDFKAIGSGTNYGTFTGAHDAIIDDDFSKYLPGMIVRAVGITHKKESHISKTLPHIELASKVNDPAVFGVYVVEVKFCEDELLGEFINDSDILIAVNAVGEGLIMVTDLNGNINNGDYITSSGRAGFGQKQSDDILRNYTVAKATESINWDDVEIDSDFGFKWKRMSCTYHCG